MERRYAEKRYTEKRNKGFTLIELIAVIVIVSIMSAGAIAGFSVYHNAKADSGAQKLVSLLEMTRQEAVNREDGSVWLKLYKDTDGDYYASLLYRDSSGDKELKNRKLGNSFLKVSVKNSSGAITYIDTTGLNIHFKKSTGGIQENYTDIFIEGSKTEDIIVIKETGRCFLEE